VTFKSSNRYNNESGRRGKITKGSGRTSLIFEQIVDLRKPKNTTNIKLDKLTSEPASPNNQKYGTRPALVARSQDLSALLRKNQRYSSQKSNDESYLDLVDALDTELLPKNNFNKDPKLGTKSGSYSIERSITRKAETFGGATFIN